MRAIQAQAEEVRAAYARGVKPGRSTPQGLRVFGINLCCYLEREGVKRSAGETSPMVEAVGVIFRDPNINVKRDPREFVRTMLKLLAK